MGVCLRGAQGVDCVLQPSNRLQGTALRAAADAERYAINIIPEVQMTEIKRSIKIKAPIKIVFKFASDYQKWPEFFEGVSDVKPITETIRGDGAKFIYKVKVLGMRVTVGTEFQQFIENKGWIGKSFKGIEHQTQWIFEQSNGHTEFTFIQNYQFPIYFGGKFIDNLFVKPQWIKIIENSVQNLKRLIEEKQTEKRVLI